MQSETMGKFSGDTDTITIATAILLRISFLKEKIENDHAKYEAAYQRIIQITDENLRNTELKKIEGWEEYFKFMPTFLNNIKVFCSNLSDIINGEPPLERNHKYYHELMCALYYIERITLSLNSLIKSPRFQTIQFQPEIHSNQVHQAKGDSARFYFTQTNLTDSLTKTRHRFKHETHIRDTAFYTQGTKKEARIKFLVYDYPVSNGYRNVVNFRLDLEERPGFHSELQLDLGFPESESIFTYPDLEDRLIKGTDNVSGHHFFLGKIDKDEFRRLASFMRKKLEGTIQ